MKLFLIIVYGKRGEYAKYMVKCSSNVMHSLHFSRKKKKFLLLEPPHYFIHRIMSSSSYNQEDLISYARYMKLKQYKIAIWDQVMLLGRMKALVKLDRASIQPYNFFHSLSFLPYSSLCFSLRLILSDAPFLVTCPLHSS